MFACSLMAAAVRLRPADTARPEAAPYRTRRMVRRVRFQDGSSTPLHLIGVELEKVGDDFGFGRVGRKAVGISPERSEHCEAMSLEGCKYGAVIFSP